MSYMYTRILQCQTFLLLIGCLFVGMESIKAEGSKDLYPKGVKGGRAYLRTSVKEAIAFPFPTVGTHYVYAEEGEQIALGSSVQSGVDKYIRLYAPNGEEVELVFEKNGGWIFTRERELVGPKLPDAKSMGKGFMPIYYPVPKGGAGVYRVEFFGMRTTVEDDILSLTYALADDKIKVGGGNYMSAWDISVAKLTGTTWNWVSGRVFTTSIAMYNPSSDKNQFRPNSGFYGVFKVLTKDGYIYNVDNNGNQGLAFTFMVNNQGFHQIGEPKTPSYESIPITEAADVQNRYYDPRKADNDVVVTQKIFYNIPDSNMPEEAIAAMDGGKTWLNTPEKQLNVADLRIEGVDGTLNQAGTKGAYIKFKNENGGEYKISIKSKTANNFPVRVLKGTTTIGENEIYWDGKDGAGHDVPAGSIDMQVELQLHGGEVHFPYIDVELNENGIIIELLSSDTRSVRSDKVYWNDVSIGNGGGDFGSKPNPRNASHNVFPEGVSSRSNGHIWGVGTTNSTGTFGDNHGIDTWTFIQGDASSTEFEVEVKIADLSIVSVDSDKAKLKKEEEVTYTIKVKNEGPSDVKNAPFSFQLPSGFEFVRSTFNGGCASESQPLVFDQNQQKFSSKLNLENKCEATYSITLKAIDLMSGPVIVEAAILRPNDVTDPDATNPEEGVLPTDPHYECENNGSEVPCNNIRENAKVVYSEASFEVIKEGIWNDLNGDKYAQVGETITYVLKVKNTGKTKLSNLVITDPLLGGVITQEPVKSNDQDEFLDVNETWTYNLTYVLTRKDLANRGVYNQATAMATDDLLAEQIEVLSTSKNPLTPSDPGYDPNRPNHTFVPLTVNSAMITNPMVRQRMKYQ